MKKSKQDVKFIILVTTDAPLLCHKKCGECLYLFAIIVANTEILLDIAAINEYRYCSHQELIWQIVNNVDIEESRKLPLWARSPFLEFEIIAPAPAKEMLVQTSSEERKEIFKSIITDSINYTEKYAIVIRRISGMPNSWPICLFCAFGNNSITFLISSIFKISIDKAV